MTEHERCKVIREFAAAYGLPQAGEDLVRQGVASGKAIDTLKAMAHSGRRDGAVGAVILSRPVEGETFEERKERLCQEWDENPHVRRGFMCKEDYVCYREAEEEGRVKFLGSMSDDPELSKLPLIG